LDLNFHFSSALGGLICLLFAMDKNSQALSSAAVITLTAFFISIALINVSSFTIYFLIFSIICLSNGHLQNISVNSIVKKFSEKTRGIVWGYAYFFNQFGKFLFASLIYKFDKDIKEGKIDVTIFPIFTIIMIQIVFIIILLTLMKKRYLIKENLGLKNFKEDKQEIKKSNNNFYSQLNLSENKDEYSNNRSIESNRISIENNTNEDNSLINQSLFESNNENVKQIKNCKSKNIISTTFSSLPKNFISSKKDNSDKYFKDMSSSTCLTDTEKIILTEDIQQINNKNSNFNNKTVQESLENGHQLIDNNDLHDDLLVTNIDYIISSLKIIFRHDILHHQFGIIFINFSLGIQFFSLINIFPHFNYNYTYAVLTEEIFYSKTIHLILLFFFPFVFLLRSITRKYLLLFAFGGNFIINLLVIINCLNSTSFVHLFRFIWNIFYITMNLYNCEAAPYKVRYLNTSIMNLFFKISCMLEIGIIEKLINVNLYLPVVFNLFILLMDLMLVSKFDYETHFKSLEDIKLELK